MIEVEDNSHDLALKQDAFFRAAKREGYTIGVLSGSTGIPTSTLESYRVKQGRKTAIMKLGAFVRLTKATRAHPQLASLLIEDSGCVISCADPHTADWLALGDRMCATASKIMRYKASDNHIDHVEDADLCADMIEIVSEGHAMIGRRS